MGILSFLKHNRLVNSIYWKYLYCPSIVRTTLPPPYTLVKPSSISNLSVIQISVNNDAFKDYVHFVNEMYDEKIYSANELKYLLSNHYYLQDIHTFILVDKTNRIFATISTGIYPNYNECGGIIKYTVDKSIRNNGIGAYMLSYGYAELYQRGCRYGESVISDRKSRVPSLMTHFKCGFAPQTDPNKVSYFLYKRKTLRVKRWFTNRWVLKYYRIFKNKHTES